MKDIFENIILLLMFVAFQMHPLMAQKQNVIICAYYFEGWAGHRGGSEAWDKNAPTHLTEKLKKDFSDREPVWGWRDDTNGIMERQINLAHENGIDCFFFDWYWADNQKGINIEKLEKKPTNNGIQRFLKAQNNSEMKFALMVANHTGAEIVGKENWLSAIDYFSKSYFNKENYLKVNGKPVLAIFQPKAMYPYLDDLRKEAVKLGYPGIYVISLGYNGKCFDAYSWYNTFQTENNITKDIKKPYKDLVSFTEGQWSKQFPNALTFPIVMTGWDRRPWQKNVLYYADRSPKQFSQHLSHAFNFLQNEKNETKMIFIYAWNEMGEGGYLVPTKGDKRGAYLKKVRKAKEKTADSSAY